jgi:RND family efflux transporter MFP subunit
MVLVLIVALCACSTDKKDEGQATGAKQAEGNGPKAEAKVSSALMVRVKPMAFERFEHYFQANGTVEAVQDAFISPEINGRIKKIHVNEGQRVKKDQLLVSLNSEIIESTIAEVKSGLELAATVYEKRKGLWDKKIGSEVLYLQSKTDKETLENKLNTLQAQLRMTRIKAPFSGIVDDISQKEGELAAPGLRIIHLVNLDKIYVNAEVSESYLPKVNTGDIVQVSFPTYPELTTNATIYRTGNVVKMENRTFVVQVLMDNPAEKLKPNILAIIKMKDFMAEAALVVPSIIIKNDLTGAYVYVLEKDDKNTKTVAQKIYVKTGMSEGSNTMVTEGLKPGQQVIVDGYNLVTNGMTVEVAAGK